MNFEYVIEIFIGSEPIKRSVYMEMSALSNDNVENWLKGDEPLRAYKSATSYQEILVGAELGPKSTITRAD